jgi:hypothetical protein
MIRSTWFGYLIAKHIEENGGLFIFPLLIL